GPPPARPPDQRGRPDRRFRPHRRAHSASRGRVGQAADRPPGCPAPDSAAGQGGPRRGRAGPGRGGDDRAAAKPGAAHGSPGPLRRAQERPGGRGARRPGRPRPGPGAAARLSCRDRLRPVPGPGQVRHLRRPAGGRRLERGPWLPVVRGPGGGLDLRPVGVRPPARRGHARARAFPGVPVRTSGAQHVLATVPAEPALVIAPPGAEPVAQDGYAAALLLDGWALLGRPSLRAAEEALRRWLNAAALVRPGGPVVVLAEASFPAVQALVRWDPVNFSERELAERAELGFPPAVRMASVTGASDAVA